MKNRWRTFFNKSLIALTMLFALSPLYLMLGAALLPTHPLAWYAYPCAAYIFGILSYLIKDKLRIAWTALSALLIIAAGFYCLLPLNNVYAFMIPLAALVFLLILAPAYRKPLGEEWSFAVWVTCFGAHLFANLLAANNPVFSPVRTPLNWVFALYALFGSLLLNYVSLRNGMGDDSRPPKSIRRRNMLATALLYLIALTVALWDVVSRALQAVVDFFKRMIGIIMDFIAGLFPQNSATGTDGGGEMDMSQWLGDEIPEPSAFSQIMEKILIGIAVALFAAGLLFCLYLLCKKLKKVLSAFLARLRAYASSVGEAYTDQAESTFNIDQWTQSARESLGKMLRRRERPTPWKQLDGRARVRRLYQDYLKRRPAAPSDTAREALLSDKRLPAADEFAALYDRARYSAHDVSPAAADALREQVTGNDRTRE